MFAGFAPATAIVAGSGIELQGLLDHVEQEVTFAEAGLPVAHVAGHPSRFVIGTCGHRRLIIQSGRIHLYEGHSQQSVATTVDVLQSLGAGSVIFTNATGGLRAEMKPGDLCVVKEIRPWPCTRVSLPPLLTPPLLVDNCGHAGTYWWMHGPCYETPAEIGALQTLGGAVVGMSTAIEAARCEELGIPYGIVSVVTNSCGAPEPLSHQQVIAVSKRASEHLVDVLRAWLEREG